MTQEELNKKIQDALNAQGEKLLVDGHLGIETLTALNNYTLSVVAIKNQAAPPPLAPQSYLSFASFFSELKINYALSSDQIGGITHILTRWDESGLTDPRWLAYMFATVKHETANTFKPVSEYGGTAYLQKKPYWPYFGRGLVQITWKKNYEKYGIENDPAKALDPDMAAHIMIDGMTKGIFTGKALKNYFNANLTDPVNARRIINGTDKAQTIAEYYDKFLPACEVLHNTPPTPAPMVTV